MQTDQIHTELQLLKLKLGFSEAYLAIQYLYLHLKKTPDTITEQTVTSLLFLLESEKFENKKQAFFLYREAADTLIHLSKDATHPLAGLTIFKLQNILIKSHGKKHRAVSEALGSLPLDITGPKIDEFEQQDALCLPFDSLLKHLNLSNLTTMQWHGRTLRFTMKTGKIGCMKFATSRDNITQLQIETFWLNFLLNNPPCPESTFKIPEPVTINGESTFKFFNLPDIVLNNDNICNEYTAIVFLADPHYFHYPNDPEIVKKSKTSIKEIFTLNAHLLGKLTAKGMVHTALIPLFHNRVQQTRRQDQGIYQWELGGRLDKWLESSRYPNFARSGLRDFEHIISIKNSEKLRHFIGEHILSFVLVLGSFFRNKNPNEIGFDQNGLPINTQHLFDKSLFSQILLDVVKAYYKGVTGISLKNIGRFFTASLIDDLVKSMGVDQHMEETLRIQDQINMDDADFIQFLISRGLTKDEIDKKIKGEDNIVLNTGPHLGGFNQPISVPKLVDFLFCLSSLCISDRYIMENRLKAFAN